MIKIHALIFSMLVICQFSFSQVSEENTERSTEESKINNLPPPPPLSPGAKDLKREADSLSQNREGLIYKLMEDISCSCIQNVSDRIIVQVSVNPSGKLDSFEIVRSNVYDPKTEEEIFNCVNGALDQKSLALGELKVVPNARNGSRAHSILYIFPIKI